MPSSSGPVRTSPTSRPGPDSRAPEPTRKTPWYASLHSLLRTLAPFPILLSLAVVVTVADVLSPSGWAYACSVGAIGLGIARGLPARSVATVRTVATHLGPALAGILVFTATAAHRLGQRTPDAEPTLGPDAASPGRTLTRLFEERDGAILGARWLSVVVASELRRLAEVLTEHYPRMEADGVELGTPILATHLGFQSAGSFDLHRIDGRGPSTDLDVVFLHGSGGSFSLLCWQVAVSVRDLGVRTWCPAMDASGGWSGRRGRAILDALLDHLHERRVVIAGLSAGSIALSTMARDVRDAHPSVVGVVLISGVARTAEPTALPTLLLHGERDRMTPIEPARIYAAAASDARLVALPQGHFAILEAHQTVEAELARFVEARLTDAD